MKFVLFMKLHTFLYYLPYTRPFFFLFRLHLDDESTKGKRIGNNLESPIWFIIKNTKENEI